MCAGTAGQRGHLPIMKSLSHFPGKLTWYRSTLLGAPGLGERLEGWVYS